MNENILKLCVKVNGVEFTDNNSHSFKTILDASKIGLYDYNRGQVAFITKDGGYYTSPFANEIIPLLEENGFVKGDLIVPFSMGATALDLNVASRWFLLDEQKKANENNKEQDTVIKSGVHR